MEMRNEMKEQIHELVVQIKAALLERGESMATAESCTGGLRDRG